MSYQTSKTAGDLWVSLVYVTTEHEKIEGFAMLSALVLAQAKAKILDLDKDSEKFSEFSKDIQILEKAANVDNISLSRDMAMSATKYTWVMTELQKKQREILPICLKYKLVEFSDGARFAGYGGDL